MIRRTVEALPRSVRPNLPTVGRRLTHDVGAHLECSARSFSTPPTIVATASKSLAVMNAADASESSCVNHTPRIPAFTPPITFSIRSSTKRFRPEVAPTPNARKISMVGFLQPTAALTVQRLIAVETRKRSALRDDHSKRSLVMHCTSTPISIHHSRKALTPLVSVYWATNSRSSVSPSPATPSRSHSSADVMIPLDAALYSRDMLVVLSRHPLLRTNGTSKSCTSSAGWYMTPIASKTTETRPMSSMISASGLEYNYDHGGLAHREATSRTPVPSR